MTEQTLKKLHGSTRGAYTGGIYDGPQINRFVGKEKASALYPFEMASATRYEGRRSPSRETEGTD
jgi:hypothetical protein